jgi:hypothetical protein
MEIPEEIARKLSDNEAIATSIIEKAEALVSSFPTDSIVLTYEISAPTDVLTPEERARSMVFVFRYDHLPEISNLTVAQYRGRYFINEIDDIRAALNEYRTIFYNKSDAIYFGRISTIYRERLVNRDPRKGLSITAKDAKENDVTVDYVSHLDSRKKAIRAIISESDFDYIFNGVLQHSDGKYSRKLINDYTSGNLNYILLRNLTLARHIKFLFKEHYKVITGLNFPRMGGL